MKAMELRANSSNNTVYADADGNIAYLHPQFIPRRDDRFDYTQPVDGADPATDWQGLHALDEAPHVLESARRLDHEHQRLAVLGRGPRQPEARGLSRATWTPPARTRAAFTPRCCSTAGKDFTADSLNALAFDPLPAGVRAPHPRLVRDHDSLPEASPLRAALADPVEMLRAWDHRWSASSVATTLAVLWGDEIRARFRKEPDARSPIYDMADRAGPEQRLAALARRLRPARPRLRHAGACPGATINRYQRLTGDIVQRFHDAAPSLPIPFTAATWGSLASFAARRYEGTAKYYGTGGNSFVAIVEFGDRVSARAVSIGGESGDPGSVHFGDQVSATPRARCGRCTSTRELAGHVEREYHPY